MKSSLKELSDDEFKLICDARNGSISDFADPYFKAHFIEGLTDVIDSLGNKWGVEGVILLIKLCGLSPLKIIQLQNSIDVYWEISDRDYEMFGYKSPDYLLRTLYHVPIHPN